MQMQHIVEYKQYALKTNHKYKHSQHQEKYTSRDVYKLKSKDFPNFILVKTWCIEHIKALAQPLIKSNFTEH